MQAYLDRMLEENKLEMSEGMMFFDRGATGKYTRNPPWL